MYPASRETQETVIRLRDVGGRSDADNRRDDRNWKSVVWPFRKRKLSCLQSRCQGIEIAE